jgi:single-strand DNA-binding protein
MSKSFQQFVCLGHVGSDPDCRVTSRNTRSARFQVATTLSVRMDGGARQQRTEWHRVVCWDKLADIVQKRLRKGACVHVVGHIEYRSYTDTQGQTFHLAEVIARDVIILALDDAADSPDDPGTSLDLPDEARVQ